MSSRPFSPQQANIEKAMAAAFERVLGAGKAEWETERTLVHLHGLQNQRETDQSGAAAQDAIHESKAQNADTARVVTNIIQELGENAKQTNLNFKRLEAQIRRGNAQQGLGRG
jgi:hypothetical protein